MALTKAQRAAAEKELREVIAKLERMKEQERIRFFVPTPKQIEFHMNPKRSKWFLAGNRVGKTVAGAILVAIISLGKDALKYMVDWPVCFLREFTRLSTEAPTEELRQKYAEMANQQYVDDLVGKYRGIAENAPQKARIWVCSDTFETQRDVVQKELVGDADTLIGGWIPKNEIKGKPTFRDSRVIDVLKLKNGVTVGFKSYDQGRRKFQGTSQHVVWEDEEPPEDVRSEIRMRLMDTKGLELGTMTPLSGLTHIYDNIYLNDSKPPGKKDPEVYCLTAGWDDNPYLSAEEKLRLESNMDENELEARKYGRFVMPGRGVFDGKKLQAMLKDCYDGQRGNLVWKGEETVEWVDDPDGEFEKWFDPEPGCEYLVAADVAEGLEHGDFDAVVALNRHRFRVDMVFHGKVDADVLGEKHIPLMATYYGVCLAAPERNNHGMTTISHLKRVYYNIYKEIVTDKQTDETRERLGWVTSKKTRPPLVDAIKRSVREETLTCYFRRFVDEAMNFIRHPDGKEAARNGYWDDVVMAMGIAVYIHNQMPVDWGAVGFVAGDYGAKKTQRRFDLDDDDDEDDDEAAGFYG